MCTRTKWFTYVIGVWDDGNCSNVDWPECGIVHIIYVWFSRRTWYRTLQGVQVHRPNCLSKDFLSTIFGGSSDWNQPTSIYGRTILGSTWLSSDLAISTAEQNKSAQYVHQVSRLYLQTVLSYWVGCVLNFERAWNTKFESLRWITLTNSNRILNVKEPMIRYGWMNLILITPE